MRLADGTGAPVELPLIASDANADALTYGATGLPPGLTINPSTGLIAGSLTGASAGVYQVIATVSDGTLSDSESFEWTVTHINRAPQLASPGNQMHAEGTAVTLALSATDGDGDVLTFSASGLPPGLILDSASGTISGTLANGDAGSYSVSAMVSDGAASATRTFTWTVVPANRVPVLANPGPQTNSESWDYSQAVRGDGPVAYWRLAESSGATVFDSLGGNSGSRFGGVTLGQQGALLDGNTAMLFNGSTGYVRAPNAPALQLTGDLTIELWLNVSLTSRQTLISKNYLREFDLTLETTGALNFYHGNGTSYSNVLSLPGAIAANTWQHLVVTRSAATKTIRFYVNGIAKGSGTYSVVPAAGTGAVSIGRSDYGVQYVNGRLDEVALYPVALAATQAASHYGLSRHAWLPMSVALQLSAMDPDNDSLSYSAIGLPPGLTINAATGLISGTLSSTSAGTYQVTATASDGALSHSQTFTWDVTHVNRVPALISPGSQTTAEGVSVSLSLTASDPDGDALIYSAIGLPPSLSLDASTGVITGTLPFTSAGTYGVTAMVSDGTVSNAQTFAWTITNTNQPPAIMNPGAQTTNGVAGYPQSVAGDAPVAYWRLGETSGSVASDSVSSHPGTLTGGVHLGQAGALADGNTAMLFNGSSGYVRVPNSAPLQLAGDLTIEMWINVSLVSRQTLISKDYLREFELTLETTGLLNLYQGNGSTYQNVLSTSGAVAANIWQHVVVTRSAATKSVRFYVNGAAKGAGTFTITPATGLSDVSIGRAKSGLQYVNGRLDDVAIYPAALSAARIAAHYAKRTSAATGVPISLQLSAIDSDGDTVTYGASGLPPGLTVDAATGLISGILLPASLGTYQVTITSSDGALSSSQTFTWTVGE